MNEELQQKIESKDVIIKDNASTL